MRTRIHRRQFLTNTGLGLAGATFLPSAALSQSSKQPNFIILFADDLGYGDIEGFGNLPLPYQTPNLAAMSREGVKLTHVYVPVPYCAPSRASLLTGRYPFRNGVVHNPAPDAGINEVGLPPEEVTLAEVLKESGYATCCIGKWHLGHKPHFLPTKQGFDEYLGILYSNDMRPVQLVENEQVVEYPVVQATLTKRYTERALDFIQRSHQAKKPFFLYLPYAMPHKPLAASEAFYTPETPDDLYADVIRELDDSVGRIVSSLRDLKIDENTCVLFLSDNGPWYGGSTGGLRGMKARTWDGGIRVPFIARWPQTIPAGIVNPSPVGTIDIFPTLLHAANVDIPENLKLDGKDIMPLLQSSEAPSPHEALYAMQGANLAIVRSGKWKLHIRKSQDQDNRTEDWIDPRGPDGVTLLAPYEQARPSEYPGVPTGDKEKTLLLFDLENDPAEQNDRSQSHPDIVIKLKEYADAIQKEMPHFSAPKHDFSGMRHIKGGTLESAYQSQ